MRIYISLCSRIARTLAVFLIISLALVAQSPKPSLELFRPVRSWEFLPVVGQRAALFGNETGNFEAWVYPLKLFRNFHLNFLVANQILPAESLARTVIVHPESCTIVYSSDTFSVRETLFVPVHEPGAIITFEINTTQPLEIEAVFERDFQLEWPAALGGTYLNWDGDLHAFALGEEQKKYAVLIGSQNASEARQEYSANYSASRENAFRLGGTNKGTDVKLLVIAASWQGQRAAESTYRHLITDYVELLNESAKYYRDYLNETVTLDLQDKQLQQAYDWSRISILQGTVTNSDLGVGLIAGYRTSRDGQRPGFAWYFGRDSMWTSLALTASGDLTNSRLALEFLTKYQRDDGKIPHEISQTANLVQWFKNFPYAYASADATPLFIIAADDYVTRSGDTNFAKEKWGSLWKAYQFLHSTYDVGGFPKNFGIGHGWVEGGPLLPVKAELYQVGLGAAALRSLSHLATLVGKNDESVQLAKAFTQQRTLLNQLFWSEDKGLFAFALDNNNVRVDTPSVLATVPMWFDLLDQDKAQRMINLLASPDHQTDWGMRIISANDPRYNPGGYHFGSVWPLFTGWASIGEYHYHRALPAYSNLQANALLALNGSLGHVTEVLSGDFNEPLSTSSPHQIWSAAMVVSPILRGMMGIETDAQGHSLKFSPHVPVDWSFFAVRGVTVGDVKLDFVYRKTADEIILEVQRKGTQNITIDFTPAISPRAKVLRAEIDGHVVPTKLEQSDLDQHVMVHFAVNHPTVTLRIRIRDDFGLGLTSVLPPLGDPSRGLRVVSESWDLQRNTLTLNVAGVAGHEYELAIWNSSQIASAEGAELQKDDQASPKLRVKFAGDNLGAYLQSKIILHFVPRS
jgi:glycogen debranching enzyme